MFEAEHSGRVYRCEYNQKKKVNNNEYAGTKAVPQPDYQGKWSFTEKVALP